MWTESIYSFNLANTEKEARISSLVTHRRRAQKRRMRKPARTDPWKPRGAIPVRCVGVPRRAAGRRARVAVSDYAGTMPFLSVAMCFERQTQDGRKSEKYSVYGHWCTFAPQAT